jgi:hypothetical protein
MDCCSTDGHISVSKHGEVLIMKRMGFVAPSALISSTAKHSYDLYFQGNLSKSNIEALDELFPACRAMTGGAVWSGTSARL